MENPKLVSCHVAFLNRDYCSNAAAIRSLIKRSSCMYAHNLSSLKKQAKIFRTIAKNHLGIDVGQCRSLSIVSEFIRNETYDVARSKLIEFEEIRRSDILKSKFYFQNTTEINDEELLSSITYNKRREMEEKNEKIEDQLIYWYSRERALLLNSYNDDKKAIKWFMNNPSFINSNGELYLRFSNHGKYIEIDIGEVVFKLESGCFANLSFGKYYRKVTKHNKSVPTSQDISIPSYVLTILKTIMSLPGVSVITYNDVGNPAMQDVLLKLGFSLAKGRGHETKNYIISI